MLKKVMRNTSWLLGSNVLSYLIGIGIIILISRSYGVASYGLFAFIESFCFLLVHLCNFGQLEYTIREAARKQEKRQAYLANLYSIKLILWGVFYLIMLSIVFLVTQDMLIRLGFVIIGFRALFRLLVLQLRVVFWSSELMKYEAYLLTFRSILAFVLMGVCVYSGFSLISIFISGAIAGFITLIVSIAILASRFFPFTIRFDRKIVKELFTFSHPFFIGRTLNKIKIRIAGWILYAVFGPAAFGIYQMAYKPIIKFGEMLQVFAGSLYPALSKLQGLMIRDLFWKGVRVASVFSVFSALSVIVSSGLIVRYLYPSIPDQGRLLIIILGCSLLFLSVNQVATVFLLSIGRSWTDAFISFVTLGLITSLGFLLVPEFGIIGAATAFIITTISTSFLKFGTILTIKHK